MPPCVDNNVNRYKKKCPASVLPIIKCRARKFSKYNYNSILIRLLFKKFSTQYGGPKYMSNANWLVHFLFVFFKEEYNSFCWKSNFRKKPHIRLFVGWSVGLSIFYKGREVTLPCFFRGICYISLCDCMKWRRHPGKIL